MNEMTESLFPIEVGQRIRLHLPERKIWTVVRGWKQPHVILVDTPQPEGSLEDLQSSTPCMVQYLREGVIHSFQTQVLGLMDLFHLTRVLGLQYPVHVKSQNLRCFPRVKIQIPAKVLEPNGEGMKCVILDISRGGCRADIPATNYIPGDPLHISFTLPNQARADIPCEVRRSIGTGQYGLEFKNLNGSSKEAVDGFLSGFAIVQSMESIKGLEQGMVGNIDEVSVPDLLQILANSRKPYQVDFTQDSDRAQVYLKEGEVFYAKSANREGAEAIFELISWPKGQYRIQAAEWFPERNVTATMEHLLLEFVYRQDLGSTNGELTPL